MHSIELCSCGSNLAVKSCCDKYFRQGAYPLTAEALMRSRYSAYCQQNLNYLIKTWHPDTCPKLNANDLANTKWIKLDVLDTKPGLKKSEVEFKAYFKNGETTDCLHERSLFKKVKNRWVYVSAL